MPKLVDHEKRRERLAEAAWRIIRRHGLEEASVRRIAEEAGISFGTLRHYFSNHKELIDYAMQLVLERGRKRLQSLQLGGEPQRDIEALVGELLPLEGKGREETEVWLSYMGKAVSDSRIKRLSLSFRRAVSASLSSLLGKLAQHHRTAGAIDVELETKRLLALLDGLALQSAVYPDEMNADEIRKVIVYHLNGLLPERMFNQF